MNPLSSDGANLSFAEFNRNFFESADYLTSIGRGSHGGKAGGLAFIQSIIREKINKEDFPSVTLNIPRMVVLRTDIFDSFMKRNDLYEIAYSDSSDTVIANAFMRADLPAEFLGDLHSLVEGVRTPLAVRSSSMLEDNLFEPFAGIYATKMISNNQASSDQRFHKLTEAIKFVYASTFFKASKDYFSAARHSIKEEKMAVIIQEVVGREHNKRFYPNFSGVARSFNFYPTGMAKPAQGVVNLALGLGKTIVDGGLTWTYCPAYPKSVPPFADPTDMLKNTQTHFWGINMGPILNYDPLKETEYMNTYQLADADYDSTLEYIASTYNASSNKIVMGMGSDGPRVLNFSQLLSLNEFGFNDLIRKILLVCQEAFGNPVEIEFAVTLNRAEKTIRFGFLQVRPMVVSSEVVDVSEDDFHADDVLLASDRVMGNGISDDILDIVFVKPENFDKRDTVKIAAEIDALNRKLVNGKIPYLLIGFGRWGSSDPWLGIPVEWGQIAGCKVIVESTLFGINVDLSQGSHFFHNLTSFKVSYFSINFDGRYKIDWNWLNSQRTLDETGFVKHIKLEKPLIVKIDGRSGKGVIKKW